jgi:hypothetical protein
MQVARVSLALDPPGPEFAITEDCQMPTIKVTALLVIDCAAGPVMHLWKVSLFFTG